MKFSIIIPIYNSEKYLKECLDSVAAYQHHDLECILVNDGSTDSSASICQQYVNQDARFRLLSQKNSGVSATRNAGIEAATGTYMIFLDADDFLADHAWEEIAFVSKNLDYDFMVFSYYTLYENGDRKEELFEGTGKAGSDIGKTCSGIGKTCTDIEKIRKMMLTTSRLNTCWGKLFRTELVKKHKIRFQTDLKTGEDFVFVLNYFQICHSAALFNLSIYYYRQHAMSAMHVNKLETRLNDTDILFEYSKKAVWPYEDEVLKKEMYGYYFSVITNLCLEFSHKSKLWNLQKQYKMILKRKNIQEILLHVETAKFVFYKKVEGILFKNNLFLLLAVYFKCKAMIGLYLDRLRKNPCWQTVSKKS